MMTKLLSFALSVFFLLVSLTLGQAADATDWPSVLKEARGETVYFNAWGGADNINAYIAWVGEEVEKRYGVHLKHVKLDDTAKAVSTVLAEKTAGKTKDGSVDLIWINGENFASMKMQGLLKEAGWAQALPNWALVDPASNPVLVTDFTLPTDGQESPWGLAKLVFFYDSARTDTASLPRSAKDILAWATSNPGRFSYPQPPDFIGSSFLKQVLIETIADRSRLAKPVDETRFAEDAAPLFAYLDALHPLLWRKGKAFPKNYPDMKQKLADGELDIIFAFNPAEASSGIEKGELPDTVRSFTFPGGTLANAHFVAIPFNATADAGALVVANFLLSPEAQIHKQDPRVWGDPTVLSASRLSDTDRAALAALPRGVATLAPADLGPALDEPHPSWMTRIEVEWSKRYGVAN
jgi:putative thiamine transport system substrate-binding protein